MSIPTKYTKDFKQLNKKSVEEAGGKGASLGEMTDARIPVPPGFVILSSAFDTFLQKSDLFQDVESKIHKVNYDDINSVTRISAIISDLILDAPVPEGLEKEFMAEFKKMNTKYVAVRSSATAEDSSVASWAGELESYLNSTEKTLLVNIKKCWASLFTPRAIFYRKEKELLDTEVSVAVVIQEMVESEISGICFTVHPVTQDRNQMIIEAGFGLGEAIVSGSVTPDSYVLDKRDLSIIDINIANQERKIVKCLKKGTKWQGIKEGDQEKQKLTGEQIIKIAKLCMDIEKHYGFPCDIEWAYAEGKFYITQSRPITTL